MILVTGSTGFLGAHLLSRLLIEGYEPLALIRTPSKKQHFRKIFSYYKKDGENYLSNIKWIEADLLDIQSLLDALDGVKHIFHCAGAVSFEKKQKRHLYRANVEGTRNLVNAALYKNVQKICHVSSIAALGTAKDKKIITEDTHWEESKTKSFYSKTKYLAELEVWRGIAEGLNAVIVKPSVVLGPGDWSSGSPSLVKTFAGKPKFFTEGVNGYVDIRDVTKIMLTLMMDDEAKNEAYILNSENISYKQLFSMIAEALHVCAPSIKANKLMLNSAVVASKIFSLVTGKETTMNSSVARMALDKCYYSNEKIRNKLHYDFIPIKETIEYVCNKYLEDF